MYRTQLQLNATVYNYPLGEYKYAYRVPYELLLVPTIYK